VYGRTEIVEIDLHLTKTCYDKNRARLQPLGAGITHWETARNEEPVKALKTNNPAKSLIQRS
jgi:hypothetical protein